MPRVDGRTRASRRYVELVQTFEAELSALTETDRVLIKQAAALSLRAEQLEAAIVAGSTVNSDEVIRLSSECRRILAGLKAKAAKKKPSGADALQQFLAQRAQRTADGSEGAE